MLILIIKRYRKGKKIDIQRFWPSKKEVTSKFSAKEKIVTKFDKY